MSVPKGDWGDRVDISDFRTPEDQAKLSLTPDTPAGPVHEATDDDFINVAHIPNSHPSRYTVQIRRYRPSEGTHVVTQTSEPLGRHEANELARKWAYWHRLEVRR